MRPDAADQAVTPLRRAEAAAKHNKFSLALRRKVCYTEKVAWMMTIGFRATSCREPCQGRKAAAISGSWRAPRRRPVRVQAILFSGRGILPRLVPFLAGFAAPPGFSVSSARTAVRALRLGCAALSSFLSPFPESAKRQARRPVPCPKPAPLQNSNPFQKGKGATAQFSGASGDAFSAICGMQISRFTSSKPSKFAFASDEKSIRRPTASFVRCCLNARRRVPSRRRRLVPFPAKRGRLYAKKLERVSSLPSFHS